MNKVRDEKDFCDTMEFERNTRIVGRQQHIAGGTTCHHRDTCRAHNLYCFFECRCIIIKKSCIIDWRKQTNLKKINVLWVAGSTVGAAGPGASAKTVSLTP